MTQELLDYSRGEINLVCKTYEVPTFISNFIEMIKSNFEAADICIESDIQYQGQQYSVDDQVFVKRLPVGHLDRCTKTSAVGNHVVERVEEGHRGEEQHEGRSTYGGDLGTHVGEQADADEELREDHQHGQYQGCTVEPFDMVGRKVVEHLVFRAQGVYSLGETAKNEKAADQYATYRQSWFIILLLEQCADEDVR